jgi:hypothetical protein
MGKVFLLALQAHYKRFDANGNGPAQAQPEVMLAFNQTGNIGAGDQETLVKLTQTPLAARQILAP